MQRGHSCEQALWPIAGIIVQEWSTPQQLVFEIGEFRAGRGLPLIVLAANTQCDAIPLRDDDRCWPYLDCKINRLAWRQRLNFIMAVVGTVRSGQSLIELAM